jgi:hypothetical protein
MEYINKAVDKVKEASEKEEFKYAAGAAAAAGLGYLAYK